MGGAGRQDAGRNGAVADEPDAEAPGETGGAAAGQRGSEFAPIAERGEELSRARDEIAARTEAAAEPNAGDGAKTNARWSGRVVTARLWFARRHELRGADDDDVANGALDFVEADPGAAALPVAAAATRHKLRKQRQQPQGQPGEAMV